jgi:hypothetical protein
VREDLGPIRFSETVQRIIDLEEKEGVAKEFIPATLDLFSDFGRGGSFESACAEAEAWVNEHSKADEYDLLRKISACYRPEEIAEAPITISRLDYQRRNPLQLALELPFPVRLTFMILALFRQYGSGGEPVNISSDLPPVPPSPGRWGGRSPGFEQPLPKPDEDLDIGPKR